MNNMLLAHTKQTYILVEQNQRPHFSTGNFRHLIFDRYTIKYKLEKIKQFQQMPLGKRIATGRGMKLN